METDASFARLLADIPEALAGDKAFVKELEDRAKVLNVKMSLLNSTYFFCPIGWEVSVNFNISVLAMALF